MTDEPATYTLTDQDGEEHPMTAAEVADFIAIVDPLPDELPEEDEPDAA